MGGEDRLARKLKLFGVWQHTENKAEMGRLGVGEIPAIDDRS